MPHFFFIFIFQSISLIGRNTQYRELRFAKILPDAIGGTFLKASVHR